MTVSVKEPKTVSVRKLKTVLVRELMIVSVRELMTFSVKAKAQGRYFQTLNIFACHKKSVKRKKLRFRAARRMLVVTS